MKIGVDIGGTKILAIRVDDSRNILARHEQPTQADRDADDIISNIVSAVNSVWDENVNGVGISCAGYISQGTIHEVPNLPSFEGVNVLEKISSEISVPVHLENDANCFALAEYHLGAASDSQIMIGLIQGTGIGGGFVINGKLVRGASGGAGEIGMVRLMDTSKWEDHISGPAIMELYATNGGENASHPGEVWSEQSNAAEKTRNTLVEKMGLFLAGLLNFLNPDTIVLGGGVANLPDEYYQRIIQAAKPHTVFGALEACTIKRFSISDDAGALGATLLFQQ